MTRKPLSILYAPVAKRDLIDRAAYLAVEAGSDISNRFLQAAAHTVDLLAKTPRMGRRCPRKSAPHIELRRIPVSDAFHRTVVFYTHTAAEIRVERILHSAQDLPRFFR